MPETNHDWTILEMPGVTDVIEQAAAKVARQYDLDPDDLIQEGRIRVTDLNRNLAECALGVNGLHLGTMQYRLEQDLAEVSRRDRMYAQRNSSYEERMDDNDDDYAPRPASVTIRQDVSGYTRELVESLLPAVWDESFCYGVRVENAPDPDMPRGTINKATGNTLGAHIADIKIGWEQAPLSLIERRALLLAYGMDWIQKEVALALGVSQQTVSNLLYKGVGKIVAQLNGDACLMCELTEVDEALAA